MVSLRSKAAHVVRRPVGRACLSASRSAPVAWSPGGSGGGPWRSGLRWPPGKEEPLRGSVSYGFAPSGTGSGRGFSTRLLPRRKRPAFLAGPLRAFSAPSPHHHQVATRAAPAASTDLMVIVWKNLWGYCTPVGARLRATGYREYLHRFDSSGRAQARSYNLMVPRGGVISLAITFRCRNAPARDRS